MRKPVAKKSVAKRKPASRKKSSFWKGNKGSFVFGILFAVLLFTIAFHYRNGLSYYLGFKSEKASSKNEDKRISDVRNFQILDKYKDKVAGFDVSEYQGNINWDEISDVDDTYPLRFVFIRATAGKNKLDSKFEYNWSESRANSFIRGAYHYYRPNENSIEQAENFIKNVKLKKGDLPPILDIEKLPENQPIDSLKIGLKRWLEKIDAHYKVKPIIYSGEKYYDAFLKKEFSEYTFWIANYNFFVEDIKDDWLFWQFTEKASISGIKGNVDVNIYNGTPKMLEYLTIN
jgi:lysozyme